jgi:hypothetical protein
VHIAARERVRLGVKAVRRDGRRHTDDRGQRLILHLHQRRRGATGFQRFADHPGHDLAVKQNLVRREQRLVMPHRAGYCSPGNVLGEQHGHHAGACRALVASRRTIFARACGAHTGHTSSIGRRCAVSST